MINRYSRILWIIIGMFIFPNMIFAIDYTEQDKLVREKVWGWDLPQFKNYTVPEKYKNESAVIIARHKLVEVKRQKISQVLCRAAALVQVYTTQIQNDL